MFVQRIRSTPHVITRLARGLDGLFVSRKSHSITGHVSVERSFDPASSYFLIIHCLSYAIHGNDVEHLYHSTLK